MSERTSERASKRTPHGEEGGRDPLPGTPCLPFCSPPRRIHAQKRRMTCVREERRNRGVRDERAARRVYLSCPLSPRAAPPPPSVHLPRRSLSPPSSPATLPYTVPPLLSSHLLSPAFLSFYHSRDTLSELVRFSFSLSLSSSHSVFLVYAFLSLGLSFSFSCILSGASLLTENSKYKSFAFLA